MDGNDVLNYVQTAASEVGSEQAREYKANRSWAEDDAKKILDRMVKDGVTDLEGALADHIYDDPAFLRDIIGDHIYGEPNRDEILDFLENSGAASMKEAVKEMRR